MSDCSIQVDLSNKSFSLNGDSEFIAKYYQGLVELVSSTNIGSLHADAENLSTASPSKDSTKTAWRSDEVSRYEQYGLFYLDENNMPNIQAKIPGDNYREQMRNVALILLLANGNAPLSASYLKEQCKRQSCLDANNFSKAFGTDTKNFIRKGKAGSRDWTLELTVPGKQAARNLAAEICPTE